MKLLIESSDYLLLPLEDTNGQLLAALQKAVVVTRDWSSGRLTPRTNTDGSLVSLDLKIVPDSVLLPPTDPIEKLTKDNKATADRWLAEYQKRNAVEAELKQLKAELEKRGISITPCTCEPSA